MPVVPAGTPGQVVVAPGVGASYRPVPDHANDLHPSAGSRPPASVDFGMSDMISVSTALLGMLAALSVGVVVGVMLGVGAFDVNRPHRHSRVGDTTSSPKPAGKLR